jgi:NAD(P)-dependent dehydrogenase (short-subunit alcohol dehydrogenase family)
MTRTAWVAGAGGGIGAACVAGLTADGFSAAVHTIGMSGRRLGDEPVSALDTDFLTAAYRVAKACPPQPVGLARRLAGARPAGEVAAGAPR